METKVKLEELEFYQRFTLNKRVYYVCPNQNRLKTTWVIAQQGGDKQLLPNDTVVIVKTKK